VVKTSPLADRSGWPTQGIGRGIFEAIQHDQLLDTLVSLLPNAALIRLLANLIQNPTGVGIPQGSSLSPLLLNCYLHQHLDLPWNAAHPQNPLLRYADDLLVLSDSRQQAITLRQELHQLLQEAGLHLKGSESTSIQDLAQEERINWLGYSINWNPTTQTFHKRIPERSWNRLVLQLEACHESTPSIPKARNTLKGWMNYLAPCVGHEDPCFIQQEIHRCLDQTGFADLYQPEEILREWSQMANRWNRFCSKMENAPEYRQLVKRIHYPVRADQQETPITVSPKTVDNEYPPAETVSSPPTVTPRKEEYPVEGGTAPPDKS